MTKVFPSDLQLLAAGTFFCCSARMRLLLPGQSCRKSLRIWMRARQGARWRLALTHRDACCMHGIQWCWQARSTLRGVGQGAMLLIIRKQPVLYAYAALIRAAA